MTRRGVLYLSSLVLLACGAHASAEPIFLSRQYARCTSCHFSPTGGGLLTPYGRSLSREELSTFGASRDSKAPSREQEFLLGAAGNTLGPVSLGIELRPSHLLIDSPGRTSSRDFLMNADLTAAMQRGAWTFYAQVGRQPLGNDTRIASFEHWVSFKTDRGLGVRAGRFLPAYGIKVADHTAFTRASLDLRNDEQVYGVELSFSGSRHLVQVSAGPGHADSEGEDGQRAFTATGRWQLDLRPRIVLVGSGLYRGPTDLDPRGGATGLALGIAPASRLTVWTQADVRFREGTSGPAYTLLADAALEVYRGVWLKISPQLLTAFGDSSGGIARVGVGLNLLPRTHWNSLVSFYHDRNRQTDRSTKTLLLQLHLYL